MRTLVIALSVCWTVGCAGDASEVEVDDPTYDLTGTEEPAVEMPDGTHACESPRKVLICHIPPGNPDNAHTICVGAPAVRAHQKNHGDPVGPCDDVDDGPDAGLPTPDAAVPPPDHDGGVD